MVSDLLAVHTANNICMESKKKNITSSEMEAPRGRHNACVVSRVANPEPVPRKSFQKQKLHQSETGLTWLLVNRFAGQQVVGTFALFPLFLFAGLLLHVETTEASVHDEQDGDQAGWDAWSEKLHSHHLKLATTETEVRKLSSCYPFCRF